MKSFAMPPPENRNTGKIRRSDTAKKNGKSHLDDHNLDPKLSQNLHGIAKLQY